MRMPSGAGHDAQMLARVCPTGMVFVPSVDGLSHNPAEYTEPADLEAGASLVPRPWGGEAISATAGFVPRRELTQVLLVPRPVLHCAELLDDRPISSLPHPSKAGFPAILLGGDGRAAF